MASALSFFIIVSMNIFILVMGVGFVVVKPITSCYSLIYGPIMTLGALLVIQSSLGLAGVCSRTPWLMWVYLLLKMMLIFAIAIGILLDGAVMTKGDMKLNTDSGEDQINMYAEWLQDRVVNAVGWPQIRECLIRQDVCSVRDGKPRWFIPTSHDVFRKLRGGCCQPPSRCAMEQMNGTKWLPPEGIPVNGNPDCKAWGNDGESMCYYCDTCKTGFLANLIVLWKKLFPLIAGLQVLLILLFIVGCNAFRHFKVLHYQNLKNSPTSTP